MKGIEINDLETKLLQFADDTTAVLSDLNSANALFSLLEEFEKASGLKLNVKKTEAMWIGAHIIKLFIFPSDSMFHAMNFCDFLMKF